MLARLTGLVSRRPLLVEAAANILETAPQLRDADVLRAIASEAMFLSVETAGMPTQQRAVLAALARVARPAGVSEIVEQAEMAGPKVSAQIGRLIDDGVVYADPPRGRSRRYDFADPVLGLLYSELVRGAKSMDSRENAA